MQKSVFKDKYPVYTLEFSQDQAKYSSVAAMLDFLHECIEAHPKAAFIARFDHLAHTQSIHGEIGEGITDAQHIILCFGMHLPSPAPMAVRPRSIGITAYHDKFVVNFMEAPNPVANEAMETWVKQLIK